MPNYFINETQVLVFALILIRVAAFLFAWPVFSVYPVPNTIKVLFAVMLSIVLFPVINQTSGIPADLASGVMWYAAREAFVGLLLGYVTRMFYYSLGVGGHVVATSMGLAAAQTFNPALNSQVTIVEELYFVIGMMFFFAMNGHHLLIDGLVQSFTALPLAGVAALTGPAGIGVAPTVGMATTASLTSADTATIVSAVVSAGLKIAAPVFVSIFFINVAMGVLGKTVPQINVLITSLPVTIYAGFLVLLISLPALLSQFQIHIGSFNEVLLSLMRRF